MRCSKGSDPAVTGGGDDVAVATVNGIITCCSDCIWRSKKCSSGQLEYWIGSSYPGIKLHRHHYCYCYDNSGNRTGSYCVPFPGDRRSPSWWLMKRMEATAYAAVAVVMACRIGQCRTDTC